jgi:hypothetical protein
MSSLLKFTTTAILRSFTKQKFKKTNGKYHTNLLSTYLFHQFIKTSVGQVLVCLRGRRTDSGLGEELFGEFLLPGVEICS